MIVERLAAQLLSGPPASTPEDVVRRLLAVQGQDARGARLSIRSRSSGLTATDVDAALTDRRSLVISWLNRGTLHLVSAEDYWWLHALTTPQLVTGNARRLGQEGVSPAQADLGVAVVVEAVSEGPQTRSRLRELLDRAGVPTQRQALVHVLMAATLRGHVVRGPVHDGDHAFVAVRDWLGEPPAPLDQDEALARLARRYLAGHGPADARDLARWAGITLGAARRGLDGLAEPGKEAAPGSVPELPPPRLLGAFDPLLLGWASREPIVDRHKQLVTTNGLFRPFALVDGRAVATWSLAGGALFIRALEQISPATERALHADALGVLRYLGLPERPAVMAP